MVQSKEDIILEIGNAAIALVYVEGGTFKMGGERFDREEPIHEVRVPSFYMAKYLVTQKLFHTVMQENPSSRKGEKRPVERVSWNKAKEFIDTLNKQTAIQATKGTFCLPTEAEWEYAARGGIYNRGYTYCGSDDLKQVAWYAANSGNETKPVGLLLPNQLGLYDMSGNVYEWCEDDWHKDYNSKDRPDDGSAWLDTPNRGAYRVLRGGGCFFSPVHCRPAYRRSNSPDFRNGNIGFRLVFSPS